MRLTRKLLDSLIMEELSKADKNEIRKMISKEVSSARKDFEKKLKKDVEKEVEKMIIVWRIIKNGGILTVIMLFATSNEKI